MQLNCFFVFVCFLVKLRHFDYHLKGFFSSEHLQAFFFSIKKNVGLTSPDMHSL